MSKWLMPGRAWGLAVLSLILTDRVFGQAMPNVPTLENTTYALVRLDLTKIDGDGIVKWMMDGIAKVVTDPAQQQQAQRSIQQAMAQLLQAQQVLVKAKATTVYFAFNEFPVMNPPLIFVQVGPGGDVEAVRTMLFSGPGGRSKGPELAAARPVTNITAALGDGVFMGHLEDFQRIKEAHVGAPHLLFALSQAPPAALQAVAAPTEAISLLLETMYPQIPPPIDLPTMTLTRGVSSTVATLQAPPDAAMKIVVQTQDAATAAQIKGVGDRLLAMLNSPQIKSQAPPGVDVQGLAAALTPKVQENQVIVELTGQQTSLLALSAILPSMARAQETSARVQSAQLIRQLVLAVMQHAKENQNALPDTLDQLVAARFGGRLPPNPRATPGQPGFVYVKAGAKLSDVKPTMVLVHENLAALPPGTTLVNVGFGDGHVDMLPLAQLQQRLAAQGAAPAK